MTTTVKLNSRNKTATRDKALVSILQGEVVVVAAEFGYFFLCDAFNQMVVNRLHEIRGDAPGTAAQVLVGSVTAVSGLAADFDSDWQKVVTAFWPGLLTVQLAPQRALNWDLGDGRQLGEFAVRVPNRPFLLSLLTKTGPLAAASAALAGQPVSRQIDDIPVAPTEIGLIVDEGELETGPASTVLRRKVIGAAGGIEVVREGAISLDELHAVLPTISSAKG